MISAIGSDPNSESKRIRHYLRAKVWRMHISEVQTLTTQYLHREVLLMKEEPVG